ncbi:MAG: amidohydrolase family protein [Acidobacteriaceae bacterium]
MRIKMLFCLVLALALPVVITAPSLGQTYDVVIRGGRVIDPETGLDGIRNVGIQGSRIAAISSKDMQGKQVLDAHGLVVSPGFIDLHQHGQTAADYRLKAFDGVTTALEMEIGTPDVAGFLANRKRGALINYGTNADYDAARALAFHTPVPAGEILPKAGPGTNDPATPEQIQQIIATLNDQIRAGALGIGMGIQYAPGASRWEVLQIFQFAAGKRLPVYTHVRSAGHSDPGSSVESFSEVIADAAVTGASLHIAHVNSSCMKDAPKCLAMVAGARARGLDITTEAYPFTAGMTEINSALFNPGWQQKFGISYSSLAMPGTGERLTRERFDQLHADPKPHPVLLYLNDDATVDNVILNPLVMIASDGIISHPREAGSYCRVLARYVRQQRSLTLDDAIRKMTLMPAQVLAQSTPAALRKGRIQVGADADIAVFDLDRVSDQSTYSHPDKPSIGMKYVLVQGVPIIVDGKLQPGVLPGKALIGHDSSPK